MTAWKFSDKHEVVAEHLPKLACACELDREELLACINSLVRYYQVRLPDAANGSPDELRALALFSSSTARFGRRGQVDYAVANEVLNKRARQEALRRPGCRVVALGWGPWDGGMVTPGLRRLFQAEGVELIRGLVPHYDIVAENFKPGTMDRLGLGYDALAALHPPLVYASVSGFGNLLPTPYRSWPAYACVPEAMGGFYSFRPEPGRLPNIGVAGALGDIGTGLLKSVGFAAAIGVVACQRGLATRGGADGVGRERRHVRGQLAIDRDATLRELAVRQHERALDQRVDRDGVAAQRGRAREAEQRGDQCVQPVDLLADELAGAVLLLLLREAVLHHGGRGPDHAERVADLVRDARGDLFARQVERAAAREDEARRTGRHGDLRQHEPGDDAPDRPRSPGCLGVVAHARSVPNRKGPPTSDP